MEQNTKSFACGCVRNVNGGAGDWQVACVMHSLAATTAASKRTFPREDGK